MSSNIKFIIGAGIAFVVLLISMIFLLNDKEKNENASSQNDSASQSSTQTEVFYLNTFETADIKTVIVENAEDSFTAVQKSRTELDSQGNETEKIYYHIEEYSDILQEEGYLYTLPNNLSCAQATLVAENVDNIADYGFEGDDTATVTLKTDTDEMTIIIGDKTPLGGYYVKYPDSNTVYSVENTAVLYCKHDLFHFISKTVLEEPEESAFPKIERVTVKRKDTDFEQIVFEYDITADYEDIIHGTSALHLMTSPIYSYLDPNNSTDITHGIFGLLANDIYKIYPTEEDLAACGFEDPFCTVLTEIDVGDEESGAIYFALGDTVEIEGVTYRYGYMGGIDVIYLFTEENAPWMVVKPEDITSDMVVGTYVFDIGTLRVESVSGNLEFVGSGDADNYSVTLDGKACDLETYKSFYQFLIKTPGDTVFVGDFEETEILCSIDIELQNDHNGVISDESFDFYSTDGRTAVIVHNGVPSFSCNISYVNALLDNIQRVINGEEVISTY